MAQDARMSVRSASWVVLLLVLGPTSEGQSEPLTEKCKARALQRATNLGDGTNTGADADFGCSSLVTKDECEATGDTSWRGAAELRNHSAQ